MLLERGDATWNIARPSQFLYGPMRIEYIVHKDGGIDATMHDYDPEE